MVRHHTEITETEDWKTSFARHPRKPEPRNRSKSKFLAAAKPRLAPAVQSLVLLLSLIGGQTVANARRSRPPK